MVSRHLTAAAPGVKLRNLILLFLLVFALTPLILAVLINLPLVLDRTALFYQKAYLQNLRADFRDLDQHLASRGGERGRDGPGARPLHGLDQPDPGRPARHHSDPVPWPRRRRALLADAGPPVQALVAKRQPPRAAQPQVC
jgi:hypothetical protein